MLKPLQIKKDNRFTYYLYTENHQEIEGQVIYKGHKLGLESQFLNQILEFKIEKARDRIYIKDYTSDDDWFISSSRNLITTIEKSYETLQTKAEKEFGKFRKVIITRI